MYAVIETGGKQLKVEAGRYYKVEKLDLEVGAKIEFKAVMSSDAAGSVKTGENAAVVTAEVLDHGKAPKIIVYKYKAKKNERKRQGHRQPYTKIKIIEIKG
ncbi:MAG TPA: 50S ribosomal protein L21 [Eubacteriales bacterium]|jgi:large subunit ribosomal protein L21|nr:50S ribosomal protein L21 [Clostridia bacterium]HRR89442.1 50S ribosomal protein L21 [Eubacteriales bacterium]HRU84802.1 50S ribosomal protein L21 [Eubacteriales bacterium]